MTEPQPAPPRVSSLDGLRGVAALVVLTAHVLVAGSATLADSFLLRGSADRWSLEWWLLHTPLQLVWASHAAVMVFFVLSGFVLALPAAHGQPFTARGYYPRRLLRLYLPVWAALLLSALLHGAIDRGATGTTWWLDAHAAPMTADGAARDALLVATPDSWAFFSVLWTLRLEVLFSLALPLYVLVAREAAKRGAGWVAAAAVAALAIMAGGDRDLTIYLPCFLLGTLLAFRTSRLPALARGRARRLAVPAVAVLLLTSAAWAGVGDRAERPLVAAGATLAVGLAIVHPALRGVLERRPAQWVGTRAFSLYLVHEPIVVSLAFLLGGGVGVALLAALSFPAALAAAHVFFKLVEAPSVRLSRRVSGGASRAPRAPRFARPARRSA